RIGAEAGAAAIDGVDLGPDRREGEGETVGFDGQDDGAGAQRREGGPARHGVHDPPEVTWPLPVEYRGVVTAGCRPALLSSLVDADEELLLALDEFEDGAVVVVVLPA